MDTGMIPVEKLAVSLLGVFRVRLGNEDLTDSFRTTKEKALFAYLVLENEAPIHRETLAELLWPDRPEGGARTSLRQALYGLRLALGRCPDPPYLLVDDETVQFNRTAAISLDVDLFSSHLDFAARLLEMGAGTTCDYRTELESVLELYRGDFLDGFFVDDNHGFQEWIAFQRERHFHRYLLALRQLAEFHIFRGELEQARHLAMREVQHAPLEEEGHRQLMEILAGLGRRSAALEQYEICRTILRDEFDVSPATETVQLYEEIRRGAITKPRGDLAVPAQARGASSIPVPLTSFIGREKELQELVSCLENPKCRLVTLIGMGGVGKTRLAIEAATAVAMKFRDGIWFLAMGGEVTPEKLEQCISRAVGVSGSRTELLRFFSSRQGVLFIDPAVSLAGSADFLIEILQHAPQIKVLVTSRERIRYQSACVFEIYPLKCPEKGVNDDLYAYPAVRLFLTRHQHRQGRAPRRHTDPDSVLRICQALKGLPLALEHAAAMAEGRSLAEVADELSTGLEQLRTDHPDVPERHRSIEAVFEPSWIRLSDGEKRVLAALSVFRDCFSEEEAAATAGATPDILERLWDRSLLMKPGYHQFALHPVVRAFVARK